MCYAALPSLPASLEELWCQDNNLTGAKGGAVVWSMRVLVLVATADGLRFCVCGNVCMYMCAVRADLGSLSSLVKLRSLNVSNQGYWQNGYYDYYYYVHVLTGEWRMQSVVW